MQREPSTRRYRKPEERRRIAGRCESSGLSQSEFAKRRLIPLSSLQRWLSEAQNAPKRVPAVVFREVRVSPPLAAASSPGWAIEVVAPDGVTLRCREGLSVDDLAKLLRGRAC